jgi:hypothetical protein
MCNRSRGNIKKRKKKTGSKYTKQNLHKVDKEKLKEHLITGNVIRCLQAKEFFLIKWISLQITLAITIAASFKQDFIQHYSL